MTHANPNKALRGQAPLTNQLRPSSPQRPLPNSRESRRQRFLTSTQNLKLTHRTAELMGILFSGGFTIEERE